jgi:hypothetical protein
MGKTAIMENRKSRGFKIEETAEDRRKGSRVFSLGLGVITEEIRSES